MLCKVPATILPTTKRVLSAPSHIKGLGPLMKLKGNLGAADHSLTFLQSYAFSNFFFLSLDLQASSTMSTLKPQGQARQIRLKPKGN